MPQRTDLYAILLSYANKHRSPSVDVEPFIQFLSKYAAHYAAGRPEWKVWETQTSSRFWVELKPLIDSGKCELDAERGRVLMLEYYVEVINKAYENLEDQAAQPFPDAQTLGLSIPDDQLMTVSIQNDMEDYMKNPLTHDMPVLRIAFPEENGVALFLARHIPRRALEASVVRLQYYIQNQNNKDYYAVRLGTQFQGKDVMIKDLLNALEQKPYECVSHIEEAGEFACLFWPYFGAQIKTELRKKNELTSSDLAAMQAVYFVEFFVSHFRTRAAIEKERELARQEIESKLERPPYLFSFKDIIGFADRNGKNLAEVFGQEALEALLKEKTTKIAEGVDPSAPGAPLPQFIIYRNRFDEQVFISKAKVFPLAARLLGDVRPNVQKSVSARWSKILRAFRREPPMENDRDFNRILSGLVAQMSPDLSMLCEDRKTYLVQTELEKGQGGLLQYTKLFDDRGTLLPMSTLLILDRKSLLTDTRIMLPFWYTIPVISAIVGFFMRLRAKKKGVPVEEPETFEEKETAPKKSGAQTTAQALKSAALQFQQETVPEGQSADQFLKSMEKRWRKILDENSHKQMIRDVQSLIKAKLQKFLAVRQGKQIGPKTINEIAAAIVFESPSLMDLDSTDQMKLYISVYISKVLRS